MSILTKKNTKAIPLNKLNGVNDEDQIMLPNFNSESEAVVKYIMEKIISLTISNHFSNVNLRKTRWRKSWLTRSDCPSQLIIRFCMM